MTAPYRYLLFLLLCLPLVSSSQKFYSRNFTIDDGLPSNTVRSVFMDSRRIMWIGTSAGLCRFDGTSFTVYNGRNGLRAENIFDITEDDSGNLWIGSMGGGISKFDGRSFTNYSDAKGLVSNEVRRVWWSRKFHCLLIGTNKGVSVLDGEKFYSLSEDVVHTQTGEFVAISYVERKKYIDIHVYGLQRAFRYYPPLHRFGEIPFRHYYDIGPSCDPLTLNNRDTVWAYGRKGIKVLNRFTKASFDSMGQVFHMCRQDSSAIWVAAWAETPSVPQMPGGLYRFDGRRVERFSEKFGINDPSVWTVYYDAVLHTLFVGTLHQGLFRIPSPVFEVYSADYFGLSSMSLSDFGIDKYGCKWIATSRGILHMDASGKPELFSKAALKSAQRMMFRKYSLLPNDYLNDPSGSFEKYEKLREDGKYPFPNPYRVVSAQYGKIMKYEPGQQYHPIVYNRYKSNYLQSFTDTSDVFFHSVAFDHRGNVYLGSGEGLFRFKTGLKQAVPECLPVFANIWTMAFDEADTLYSSSYWDKGMNHIILFPSLFFPDHYYFLPEEGAPENPIRTVARGNEIWSVSRVNGLFLTYRGKNIAFSKRDSTLPRSLNDVCFDGPENVIVGSNSGEIIIGRREGDSFRVLYRISEKEGLNGKSVRWVCVDQRHFLYTGTNRGLNIIDLEKLYKTGDPGVRFYSRESGYSSLNAKRAVCDSAGDIWLIAEHDICRIRTGLIRTNPAHSLRLVFTGMEINDKPLSEIWPDKVDPWFGSTEEQIRLTYQQNNIVFFFKTMNYPAPEQMLYRYRLLPVILGWTAFSNEPKAVFTTLNPGKYTLEVESVSPLDRSLKSRISMSFVIRPPVYKRWWFILTGIVLIIALLITAYIFRARVIRRQEKEKAEIRLELNNLELKALKAQMNPHFIFNAINSIQSYILSKDIDKALYYLGLFAKLVRRTLENASREKITISEELEYLSFYIELERMRFEDVFDFEMEIDPSLALQTTLIPPMIVQPFIENAIKHGLLRKHEKGMLILRLKDLNSTQYHFIIEDNGVGRKYAGELRASERPHHQSKATEMTLRRIDLLNENGFKGLYGIEVVDLYDASGKPVGTRVVLTLPKEMA